MGGKKLPTKKAKEEGARAVQNQKTAVQEEDAKWKVRERKAVLGALVDVIHAANQSRLST